MSVEHAQEKSLFFIRNNLHPVWYLLDNDGNHVKDANGNKVLQFHIPESEELSSLSMHKKLLVFCCANFFPTVHLSAGILAIKGYCVTFPQDITDMCNELPHKINNHYFIWIIGGKATLAIVCLSL